MTAGGPFQAARSCGPFRLWLGSGMHWDVGAASRAAGRPPEPGRDLPVTQLIATARRVVVCLATLFPGPYQVFLSYCNQINFISSSLTNPELRQRCLGAGTDTEPPSPTGAASSSYWGWIGRASAHVGCLSGAWAQLSQGLPGFSWGLLVAGTRHMKKAIPTQAFGWVLLAKNWAKSFQIHECSTFRTTFYMLRVKK